MISQRRYQILDVALHLSSDSEELIKSFDLDYSWFASERTQRTSRLEAFVQLREYPACIRINGRSVSLEGHPYRLNGAHYLLLRAVFAEIRSYFLFHAGVVARDGRALILAGPPGIGKTTLVLSLVEQGFDFLSDDFCAFHRKTKLVFPFPRSAWVRESPRDSSGTPVPSRPDSHTPTTRRNAHPVPVDRIRTVATSACRPGAVVFLDTGLPAAPFHEIVILFKQADGVSVAELAAIGDAEVRQHTDERRRYTVRFPVRRGLSTSVRAYLDRHQEEIWTAYREDAIAPDFRQEPLVDTLPTHEAAFTLLGDLKHDVCGSQAPNARLSFSQAVFEVNSLISGVPCFRLRVGRLDSMLDILRETAEAHR